MLGAGHPPHAVLAGDQPPLAIAGIAVGIVGGLAKNADRAGFLLPFEDPVIGDVAPQQRAELAEPDRPLAPPAAGIEPLDRGVHRRADRLEARIERDDCGIGIGLGGLPVSRHRGSPSCLWRRAEAPARGWRVSAGRSSRLVRGRAP